MQTPFVTDLTATARQGDVLPAIVTLRMLDATGAAIGVTVLSAQQLAETGRALLAMAEAATLHAAARDAHPLPPRIVLPLMADIAIADREAA